MPRNAIEGFEELADEFEAAADALEDAAADAEAALDEAAEETAQQVRDTAQANAPVDTGELRDSIHIDKQNQLAYFVIADVEYAAAVEYGHSGYTVTPNGDSPLRFEYEGEIVYAMKADIPPRPPNPFLRNSLMEHRPTLRRNIRQALRETLQGALEDR